MQTKLQSFIEAWANILIGYVVAVASQAVIFPLFDVHVPLSTNMLMGLWFTLISLVRSYALRRWFNRRLRSGQNPETKSG